MKSLIVEPAHSFKMVQRPIPAAGPGRVIIKTKYAAICGSDSMLWNTAPGLSPGHEFSALSTIRAPFPCGPAPGCARRSSTPAASAGSACPGGSTCAGR